MSVNDEAEHPWLVEEKRLIGDAVHAGTPFWGACLGVQQDCRRHHAVIRDQEFEDQRQIGQRAQRRGPARRCAGGAEIDQRGMGAVALQHRGAPVAPIGKHAPQLGPAAQLGMALARSPFPVKCAFAGSPCRLAALVGVSVSEADMTSRRTIEHYLRLIAGDGLTDADLLIAAKALRAAMRAEEQDQEQHTQEDRYAIQRQANRNGL